MVREPNRGVFVASLGARDIHFHDVCKALETGDTELAADCLTDYLARSEEHQTAVHASGPEASK